VSSRRPALDRVDDFGFVEQVLVERGRLA